MDKPFDYGQEEGTGAFRVQTEDDNSAGSENEITARIGRLQASLNLLRERDPELFWAMENHRIEHQPANLYVEGYEHCSETILALLRCAHVYGVNVTIIPRPSRTIRDAKHMRRSIDGPEMG